MKPEKISPSNIEIINRLFAEGEKHYDNIINFSLPMTTDAEGLIDDVSFFLEHPEYKHFAEPMLREALKKITQIVL